ncbi:hypothetical protein L211DRAFT_898343 [Terfezia boudieri ATCC MYA-4762]|uniref:Myb-like domain-containing protein n=1 Tax=Terfezia boudieri ATCC MYA-4762 TaxID=1051890 RepID=A0A3N4L9B5_9PEZI|nr:hypothetical protein L211DRAFT_898343 [Terfezia boudieri ATCC MYA-4762]
MDKLAHCGSVGSDPTLLYAQNTVGFSYSSLDVDCHNYNETPMTTAPPSPYSVYPAFSYDIEELGLRIKTEQDLVSMDYPQVHHLREGTADPWMHSPQSLKTQSGATPVPLHEITDWSKITPPISPDHYDQSSEHVHVPEGLCIPFVPSKGRKRRSTSGSGRTQARNSRNASKILPELSSPGPGAASPGSNSIEDSIMYQLLYELREKRQLSWKACAEVIKEHGKAYKVPALQMRYKRLKEKALAWGPEDSPNVTRTLSSYGIET